MDARFLGVMGCAFIIAGLSRPTISAYGKEGIAPPKIKAVSKEEKATLLAAETDEQKALRKKLRTAGKIFYNANCDGVDRIYAMNADGSEVKCLTPAPQIASTYPHISPDGKILLFTRMTTGKVLKALPAGKNFPISGKRLSASLMAIHQLDLGTGKVIALAAGVNAHWASDGKKIAYMMYTAKSKIAMRAAILDLTTKTESVISHPGIRVFGMPCFSADMKRLIISNGGTAVWVQLNETGTGIADGGKVSAITGGHPCNMEVSSDGKWLSWVLDTHADTGGWLSYGAFNPGGKRMRAKKFALGWQAGSVNYFPDFSPDGTYFGFIRLMRRWA